MILKKYTLSLVPHDYAGFMVNMFVDWMWWGDSITEKTTGEGKGKRGCKQALF